MKVQLLPSSFDAQERAAPQQRLTCFIINDSLAVDAGSIAIALNEKQSKNVRNIVITHPHIDHVATLPIFVDDRFMTLLRPIRVYAIPEVIDILERDVFNWTLYPRFTELRNDYGPVMEYFPIKICEEFQVGRLRIVAVPVNHVVPTVGLIISDDDATIALTSDTSHTTEIWELVDQLPRLDALLIEASFPNALADLAESARHLTPATLKQELGKLRHADADILVTHLKAPYREILIPELMSLNIPNLRLMEPGRVYEW